MLNDQVVNLESVVGTLQLDANKTIRHFGRHESDFTINLVFSPKTTESRLQTFSV